MASCEGRARQACLCPLDVAREQRIDVARDRWIQGATPFARSKALRELKREIAERSAAARKIFGDSEYVR